MSPSPESVVFSSDKALAGAPRPEVIGDLYRSLLVPNAYTAPWTSGEKAQNVNVREMGDALELHLQEWNVANVDTPINWEIKQDGQGWLGLEGEREIQEFFVLEGLWHLALQSTGAEPNGDVLTDQEFFVAAEQIAAGSELFSSLKGLEIERPNGTKKKVWPHIEAVVSGLRSKELSASQKNSQEVRRAELRFIAFTHDMCNLFVIDNDWPQLHAHGGAAFLYRFFVTHMNFSSEKSAELARTVDLHHLLQLLDLEKPKPAVANETVQSDRVIYPREAATFFASLDGGIDELERLILFSLADVGERPEFRAEHIAALLGIVRELATMEKQDEESEEIISFFERTIALSSWYLRQLNEADENVQDAHLLSKLQELGQLIWAKIQEIIMLVDLFKDLNPHSVIQLITE